MKILKRLSAILLILAMVFSFAGCHKKGEIAVTVDGHDFTSGYYMCAFIFSDIEAQGKVDAESDVEYTKQKIDGKKYATWVKENAINTLKVTAYIKNLCKENGITLDDATKEDTEYIAEFYWDSYGYSEIFGNNGVSKETFKNYMVDSAYQDEYFDYIYGSEGTDAISETAIKDVLKQRFYIADILEMDLSELDDAAVLEAQDEFKGYEESLKNNTITFEDAYAQINPDASTDASTDENTPQDSLATIVGDEDTNYSSIYYTDLADMEIGEIKYVDKTDDLKIAVLIKKDINADPYYLTTLDSHIRQLIAGDKFKSDMAAGADKLDAKINNYAVNAFKVENIVYPEYSA